MAYKKKIIILLPARYSSTRIKNKLIILDNASSHRNQLVKDVIKKDNNLLYAVPYQHYTNAIEGYFNVLKSRLQKKKGLTYDELVKNVKDVFFLSGGSIKSGICLWVPAAVTIIPINISIAATNPYSDHASGLYLPSEKVSVTLEGPNQNHTKL